MSKVIDFGATYRVFEPGTADRLETALENISDGAAGVALVCQAFERWQADPETSMDQHMRDLLDAYDSATAAS